MSAVSSPFGTIQERLPRVAGSRAAAQRSLNFFRSGAGAASPPKAAAALPAEAVVAHVQPSGCDGRLTDVSLRPLIGPSPFLKLFSLSYRHDGGSQKTWHAVQAHDAVTVLLYDRDLRAFVFVRQFRPPCWLATPQAEKDRVSAGLTLELVAGLLDKAGASAEEVAAAECWEEAGYKVKADQLKPIGAFREAVGCVGNRVLCYFAEVGTADRLGCGGGLVEEGEAIEVVHLPVADALRVANGCAPGGESTSAFEPALLRWWFMQRAEEAHAADRRNAFLGGVGVGLALALVGGIALRCGRAVTVYSLRG